MKWALERQVGGSEELGAREVFYGIRKGGNGYEGEGREERKDHFVRRREGRVSSRGEWEEYGRRVGRKKGGGRGEIEGDWREKGEEQGEGLMDR